LATFAVCAAVRFLFALWLLSDLRPVSRSQAKVSLMGITHLQIRVTI
jgi:hypothetical protein